MSGTATAQPLIELDGVTKAFFTDKGKPAPKVAQDIRKVLDDKDVDAVSLATPNHLLLR